MAKRRGRYSSGRYRIPVRSLILLLTLVLLIGSGIGMTVGFLSTRTEPVQNDFTYGKVSCEVLETFDKENNRYIKRDVRIKNTGNTSAYIRVLLVFTWKDKDGNVYVNKPQINKDYQINPDLSKGWSIYQNSIGTFSYYYKYPVAAGEATPNLIDSLRQTPGVVGPENGKYALSVEIVADAVQAEPADAVTNAWDGATVDEDGALTITGGVSHEN